MSGFQGLPFAVHLHPGEQIVRWLPGDRRRQRVYVVLTNRRVTLVSNVGVVTDSYPLAELGDAAWNDRSRTLTVIAQGVVLVIQAPIGDGAAMAAAITRQTQGPTGGTPQPSPAPGTPPRKKLKRWHKIAIAGAAAFIGIGVIANLADPHDSKPSPAAAANSLATTTAPQPTSTTPPVTTTATATPESPAAVAAVVPSTVDASRAEETVHLLDTLPVKGRAAASGYDRNQFGQTWSDDVTVEDGHNGCDTRNDILRRDLSNITIKPGTRGCKVLTGTLDDPYTAAIIHFRQGKSTSSELQIDHVVALKDAWVKGAQLLSADQRRNFANDPRNLLAVDGSANEQKSDGDAATWLPKNTAFRCAYVAEQVQVKSDYHLWVTSAEYQAIRGVLATCGAEPYQPPAPTTTTPTTTTEDAPEPTQVQHTQARPAQPADTNPLPAVADPGQSGVSAVCDDGTLSYSAHRRGTCSHHGGVAQWLKDLPS